MMEWFKTRYADHDRIKGQGRGPRGGEYVPIVEKKGLWANHWKRLSICIGTILISTMTLAGGAVFAATCLHSRSWYCPDLFCYGLTSDMLFIGAFLLFALIVAVVTVVQTVRHDRLMGSLMEDVETPEHVEAAIARAAAPSRPPLASRERYFGGRRWLYWILGVFWGAGFAAAAVHVLSDLVTREVDFSLVMSACIWTALFWLVVFLAGLPFLTLVRRFILPR